MKIERDERRNLRRLTSPGGQFIAFEHDSNDRIIKAFDNHNLAVNYVYDSGERLVLVEKPGSVRRYGYEGMFLTSIEEDGLRLADFQYTGGRIAKVSLADGRSYKFRFKYDGDRIVRSFVSGSDGDVKTFDIKPY